jgi:HemY protein
MRFLLLALLVLAGAAGLALLARHDPGYVLFAYGGWTAETSLALVVVGLLLAFVALYTGVRLLVGSWRLPQRFGRWRRGRHALRSRIATRRGLIALAEGNWGKAERYLTRFVRDSETPLINYLGAARAAQKQGADDRRDRYLAQAHRSTPEAQLAVGLTQAEVQLLQGQTEHALATLMHLRQVAPRHGYVLHLLKRVYERLGSWSELVELLPELRRTRAVTPADADALERQALTELLRRAENDLGRAHEVWNRVPKGQRKGPLLTAYATLLVRHGAVEVAEKVLRETLNQQCDPALVRLYGLTAGPDPQRQLVQVEGWLRERERQPDLLLAAGRLAARCGLWGKARAYLEASLGVEQRAETYCALGHLLVRFEEPEEANRCFRKGLELATGTACVDDRPLPVAVRR